jgi:hypothetical protein
LTESREVPFSQAIVPVGFLLVTIAYGLVARPLFLGQRRFRWSWCSSSPRRSR